MSAGLPVALVREEEASSMLSALMDRERRLAIVCGGCSLVAGRESLGDRAGVDDDVGCGAVPLPPPPPPAAAAAVAGRPCITLCRRSVMDPRRLLEGAVEASNQRKGRNE